MSKIESIIVLFVVLFMFWLFSVFVDLMANQEECINNGYPESGTTWDLRSYCVDSVNIYREDKVMWLE